jgi:N-acylneuraminate cytidylyltransferase
MVVYLRPTTPFRSSGTVLGAIKLMSFKGGYDSLRSVEEMSESAYKCFRIKHGILRPLMDGIDVTDRPNQELERTYHPNGYVDIVRSKIVERGANERFLWGEGRYAYITRKVIEIDTEADWQYAEWWIQKRG